MTMDTAAVKAYITEHGLTRADLGAIISKASIIPDHFKAMAYMMVYQIKDEDLIKLGPVAVDILDCLEKKEINRLTAILSGAGLPLPIVQGFIRYVQASFQDK